jgi:hypothetical protein
MQTWHELFAINAWFFSWALITVLLLSIALLYLPTRRVLTPFESNIRFMNRRKNLKMAIIAPRLAGLNKTTVLSCQFWLSSFGNALNRDEWRVWQIVNYCTFLFDARAHQGTGGAGFWAILKTKGLAKERGFKRAGTGSSISSP